jgi:hypothetical protein
MGNRGNAIEHQVVARLPKGTEDGSNTSMPNMLGEVAAGRRAKAPDGEVPSGDDDAKPRLYRGSESAFEEQVPPGLHLRAGHANSRRSEVLEVKVVASAQPINVSKVAENLHLSRKTGGQAISADTSIG